MMNRTRRLATLTFLVAPVLAVGPAVAAHASTAATPGATSAATPAATPGATSRAACHIDTESDGRYHVWGVGFPGDTKVTYSGSISGSISTDKSGRFDIGGLSGSKFVVKTGDGTTSLTCARIDH